MTIPLYVRNTTPDKKVKDEFVCNIDIVSSKWLGLFEKSLHAGIKFIVADYSRDERPLSAQRGIQTALAEGKLIETVGLCACSSVVGSCSEDEKKLAGFIKYLVDRKKCAVVNIGQDVKVFLIPITLADQSTALYAAAVPPLSSLVPQIAESKPTTNKSADADQAGRTKDSKQVPSAPLNFLSSLVNRMDSTSKLLAQAVAPPPAPVINIFEALENETREKLQEFERDPQLTKLAFAPLPRDHRAVIHDIIAEVEYLVSWSEGDDDERHVVAYRRGFEPPNFISHQHERLLLKRSKGGLVAGKKGSSIGKQPDREAQGDVEAIRVERVKRDRRSVEEVEEYIKQKKQG
eukprot:gene37138-45080_t